LAGTTLELGPVVLDVVAGEGGPRPSQLRDTSELVFDEGPEVSGELTHVEELERLLRSLETQRRTGSLTLGTDGAAGHLVLCLGRIMSARLGPRRGREAALA